MTNNRVNKKFPPPYVAENKKDHTGIEPWCIWLHKHSNNNITTILLRLGRERYLVVYISLKRTYDPKWKLFGCWTGGEGHFKALAELQLAKSKVVEVDNTLVDVDTDNDDSSSDDKNENLTMPSSTTSDVLAWLGLKARDWFWLGLAWAMAFGCNMTSMYWVFKKINLNTLNNLLNPILNIAFLEHFNYGHNKM